MPAPVRIDIRELGGGIHEDWEDTAILANAHVAYFPSVAPAGGYEYPRYGSSLITVPYTLLKDYGGELTDQMVRNLLMKHTAAGEYPVIRYTGVVPEIVSLLPAEESAILTWYAEDPSYTFNVYKSLYKDSLFALEAGGLVGASGNNQLTISSLDSSVTYYFYITAVSTTGTESPWSKIYGVKVL